MPMYDQGLPAGLLAFAGGGAGTQYGSGFGQSLGGALEAFGNAETRQAQSQDAQLSQMLEIARYEREVRQAEEAAAAAQAQQQQTQQLRGQIPQGLQELFDVDQGTAIKRAFPEAQDPTSLMQNIAATGRQPGTEAYQAALLQAINKPAVQINQPKLETGMIPVDPTDLSKGVYPAPGGSKDPTNPKNWTGEQRKAAGYAGQMARSNEKMVKLESQGFNPASAGNIIRGVARPIQSADAKAYNDYRDDFIRAILRKQSGAQITADERADYQGYFPVTGDGAADIQRKAEIRQQLVGGVAAEAGPAYQPPAPSLETLSTEELLQLYQGMQ